MAAVRWMSCAQCLPEAHREVLVALAGAPRPWIAHWCWRTVTTASGAREQRQCWIPGVRPLDTLDHWAPLPPMPKPRKS